MNERLTDLEAELAAMRPRALPPTLVDRIDGALAAAAAVAAAAVAAGVPRASRWPDRFLLSAAGAGAAAACVIVATLLRSAAAPPLPTARTPMVAATAGSDPPRAGDYARAVARAEFGP